MEERRQQQSTTATEGYLRRLSALALLDRLPTAMLGVGVVGDIAYANPACAELLGYIDGTTVTQLRLPELMVGHKALAPIDCVKTLRTATSLVEWNHSQDYVIRTMLSAPLRLNQPDTLLLIGITDVTDWLWETNRMGEVRRTEDRRLCRCMQDHGPS
jgi:PAS domain-containing protein